jgi:hypothetical protein
MLHFFERVEEGKVVQVIQVAERKEQEVKIWILSISDVSPISEATHFNTGAISRDHSNAYRAAYIASGWNAYSTSSSNAYITSDNKWYRITNAANSNSIAVNARSSASRRTNELPHVCTNEEPNLRANIGTNNAWWFQAVPISSSDKEDGWADHRNKTAVNYNTTSTKADFETNSRIPHALSNENSHEKPN